MEDAEKVIWEGKGQIIYDFKIEPSPEREEGNNSLWQARTFRDAWKYGLSIAGASGKYETDVPEVYFLADTREGLLRDMATYIDIALRKADNSFQSLPAISPDNIKITDSAGAFANIDINTLLRNAAMLANQPPPMGEPAYLIVVSEDGYSAEDKKYTAKIIYANGAINYTELAEANNYLKEGVEKFSNLSAQQVPYVVAKYILTTARKNEIQPTQANTKIINFTDNPQFTIPQIAAYVLNLMPQVMPPQMPQAQPQALQQPPAYSTAQPVNQANAGIKARLGAEPAAQVQQQKEKEEAKPSPEPPEIEESQEEAKEKTEFAFFKPDYGFDSVIGMDAEKKFLHNNIILGIKRPDLFKKYKKSLNDGFILYGPPGTGKTYLVGALAHEAGMKLIIVNINQLLDQYVGNTEKNIHAIFEQARKNAPSIILFDELDALAMSRNRTREAGNSSALALNQILMEMSGLGNKNDEVVVMGTTNEPQDIDTALLRSGRFTNMLYIRAPDEEVRKKLFEFYTKDLPKKEVDYEELAKESKNFSPADIQAIVKAAVTPLIAEAAENDIENELTTEDLLKVIRKKRASGSTLVKWYEDMNKLEKKDEFTEQEKLLYAPMFEDIKRHLKTSSAAKRKAKILKSKKRLKA